MYYRTQTQPREQCGFPAQEERGSQGLKSFSMTSTAREATSRNLTVRFMLCGQELSRTLFSRGRGSHPKPTDEANQSVLRMTKSSAPEILTCSSFFSFLKMTRKQTKGRAGLLSVLPAFQVAMIHAYCLLSV